VIAERSRLKILLLLYYNDSLPVCVIARALGLDQSLVSHHLKTLKETGLVMYEKITKYRLYRLTNYATTLIHTILKTVLKPSSHTD